MLVGQHNYSVCYEPINLKACAELMNSLNGFKESMQQLQDGF